MTTYSLKPGTYLVGDPAMIIKKTGDGMVLSEHLWEVFYQNPQTFQRLSLDGVSFLITRTAEGDGIYQGVGTDTGTIMIIDVDQHQHDERLHLGLDRRGMMTLRLHEEMTVSMDRFNLYFSNGITIITNSDDM
jgi:hypothetical protein